LAGLPVNIIFIRMARSDDDLRFRPKLGRTRSRGAGRLPKSFVAQVRREMNRSGAMAGHARLPGAGDTPRIRDLPAKRGRGATFVGSRAYSARGWKHTQPGARRVVVKAQYVPLRAGSRAAQVHLRYLQRDGVTRDGQPGRLYSAIEDQADGGAFVERGRDDPRQFRLIVATEDGAELSDLRAFTRDLMGDMERDLGTKLDWVAVDHFNTGHPHTHIAIRGLDDRGKNLVIAGSYLAHGIRERASELATLELGPQTEREVQQKLRNEIDQERLTRIDRAMLREAGDGVLDMRPEAGAHRSEFDRTLRVSRLQKLERLGLAREIEPGRWRLRPEMEERLQKLGERGDVIKTIHRSLSERGIERNVGEYAIHGQQEPIEEPIIGRLVDRGLSVDDMSDRVHLVVDGIDGRAHYIEVPLSTEDADTAPIGSMIEIGSERTGPRAADRNIARLARDGGGEYRPSEHLDRARESQRIPDPDAFVESHVRRLEALRRAGIVERLSADSWLIPGDIEQRAADYDGKRGRQTNFRVLSTLDLESQATADDATWIDRQLVGRDRAQRGIGGFGFEVEQAMERRREHLIGDGLARRDDSGRMLYRRDLLATLEQRELARAGKEIGKGRDVPFRMAEPGETVRGTYRESVQLTSGKYALVENAREFTLVPWRPVIEKELGQEVIGVVRDSGISWSIGRELGLGI
jgi:type IV secretory pathway VirD2 relaxase